MTPTTTTKKKSRTGQSGWTLDRVLREISAGNRRVVTHTSSDLDSLLSLVLYAHLVGIRVQNLILRRETAALRMAPSGWVPLDVDYGLKGLETSCFATLMNVCAKDGVPPELSDVPQALAGLMTHVTAQDKARTHKLPPGLRYWTFGAMLTRLKVGQQERHVRGEEKFLRQLSWAQEIFDFLLYYGRAKLAGKVGDDSVHDAELIALLEAECDRREPESIGTKRALETVRESIRAMRAGEHLVLPEEIQAGMLHTLFRAWKLANVPEGTLVNRVSEEIELARIQGVSRIELEATILPLVTYLAGGRIAVLPAQNYAGMFEILFDRGVEFVVYDDGRLSVGIKRNSRLDEPHLGQLLSPHFAGQMQGDVPVDGWFAHPDGFSFVWGTFKARPTRPAPMNGMQLGQLLEHCLLPAADAGSSAETK